MAESRRTTTFSPSLAREIRDFVADESGTLERVPSQNRGRVPSTKQTWARISGSATSDTGVVTHDWVEVRWDFATKAFETTPDGRTGTYVLNYVVNGADPTVALDVGTVVFVVRQDDPATGKNIWVVPAQGSGGDIDAGEYVGMQLTTTANNVVAWAFAQLHSIP